MIFFYSFKTSLCVQYSPDLITVSSLFLAALHLDLKPTNLSMKANAFETTWYDLLNADIEEESLRGISIDLVNYPTYYHCYRHMQPDFERIQ